MNHNFSIDRVIRAGLAALILEGVVIGIPALFFPRWFYLNFPFGNGWLTKLGPYNEHYSRDIGALYLGITVVTAYAAVRLLPDFVTGVCLANAVAAFPHMVYHIAMWRMSGVFPTIVQAGTLAATVLIALAVMRINLGRGLQVVVVPAGTSARATSGRGARV